MESVKGQLTLRGALIGCIGCVIITAASAYTALKLGALPWPIVFAAIISLFFLKALNRGSANLHEANVTHTIMSAGSMVAGGLAFTIPGAWMLGLADQISLFDLSLVALCGVVLGLVCTGFLRKHFVEDSELEYPIGESAAQTLKAGNEGGKVGAKLFGAMGLAGVYTALRDMVGAIPTMLLTGIKIPGVSFGIYNSPMMIAVGFLVGTSAVAVWFAGALFSNFGLIWGATSLGLWDLSTANGVVSSLGMGCMMGAGIGVIVKDVIPAALRAVSGKSAPKKSSNAGSASGSAKVKAGLIVLAIAACALVLCMGLELGPIPSLIVVALVWVATAMSAQSVGQTGIDPMEIFGLIVLLAVAAVSDTPQVQLFFVAAVVAVACGLAGDVMNDFHAGHVLGTSPKAQMLGQSLGAVVGAVVSVAVMVLLLSAYGPESFGTQGSFIATQASVVASMVSGIPNIPAFWIGLAGGLALYLLRFPSMMLGLGIYLPFYMSLTAFLGAVLKLAVKAVQKKRGTIDEGAADQTGLIIASGVLGGESVIGIVSAIVVMCSGL